MEIDNLVVQLAVAGGGGEIRGHLKTLGIDRYVDLEETNPVLPYIKRLQRLRVNPKHGMSVSHGETLIRLIHEKTFFNTFHRYEGKTLIRTCAPGKTGNVTLNKTLTAHQIPFQFMEHTPELCFKELFEATNTTMKIVTGVRDPMAINFSAPFQLISVFPYSSWAFDAPLSEMDPPFFQDGGDVQTFFDVWQASTCYKKGEYCSHAQDFFQRFSEHILHLFDYSFDKEKGYTIIKKGNIEVFLYQLEKMNDILPAFSDFVGCSITKWEKDNDASGKWVGETYKKALEEVTISPQFFEDCYKEDWISHFYSQTDIERFQEKWRKNIKQ